MATNPMHKFQVNKIGPRIEISGVDLSFTNASLFMLISGILITVLFLLGTKEKKLVPGKIQLISEMLYNFISKMISDTAGKKAKPFFPFIFSLLIFILVCNMVGMLTYSFTVTCHIIVTLTFAMFIFVGVTILGFIMHGFKYLKIFIPSGVPIVLLPIISIIEIITYLSRPVSLSVRLFGIGLIFGNYLSGAMRNPSAAQKQFPNLLLGFALAEATGLFGLVVALIILFAF